MRSTFKTDRDIEALGTTLPLIELGGFIRETVENNFVETWLGKCTNRVMTMGINPNVGTEFEPAVRKKLAEYEKALTAGKIINVDASLEREMMDLIDKHLNEIEDIWEPLPGNPEVQITKKKGEVI